MKIGPLFILAAALTLPLLGHPMPTHTTRTCTDPLGCVTVGPDEPIHIGYALVTEGQDASLGIDSRNGVEIAIADSGGQILGHPIQFDGVNTGCNYAAGQAAGQALAADASIVAVVGTSCSSEAWAAVPLLSAAGFVIVSPSNTATELTEPSNPNNYPGYFRTIHSDAVQGTGAAQYAYGQLGARKAATIHDGSSYTNNLQRAFTAEFVRLGGTITAQEAIDPGQTNMSAVLTSVAAGAPDLLFFSVFMPAGGYLISQTRTTPGLQNAHLMGSDALFTPDVVSAAGASVEGFLVASPDLTQNSAEYFEHFLPAYQAQFGPPISFYHAHAYDAFMLIRAAIQRVAVAQADGAVQIGRQALRNAMVNTRRFPGLTGDLTCSATGDCADPHIGIFRFHAGQFPPEHIWPQTSDTATPEHGGEVTSYDGDTTVLVPAGAVSAPVDLACRLAHGAPPGGNLIGVGQMFAVVAVYSGTSQPAQPAPGRTVVLTVQYTNAELGPAIENTLALYYWDSSHWVKELSSVVSPGTNTVTATPSHFSTWAVLGETRRVYLPLAVKRS